jgi:hypothetical protein
MTSTRDHSAQGHFGQGFEAKDYTVDRLGIDGVPLFCIGREKHNVNAKWYGCFDSNGKKIPPSDLTFCEACGSRNFKSDEVYEVTDEDYTSINRSFLVCDTRNTDMCRDTFGIDRRCIHKQGIRVNINAVERDGDKWAPLMTIPTEEGKVAASGGVGIYGIPSMTYWECIIRGDPRGEYRNDPDIYFKVAKAKFGDDRAVSITNHEGNSNFYTPIGGTILTINSYKTGVSGQRFFYAAPAKLETDNGLEASHNKKSNILYLTISIYRKVLLGEEKEEKGLSSDEDDGIQYRGGTTRGGAKGGGGGTTRGGAKGGGGATTRGGSHDMEACSSSYSGGSNFAADGYSRHIKTHRVNARFDEIETVDVIIQLVNNQSDEELESLAIEAQKQVDMAKEAAIAKLMVEREIIDKKIAAIRQNETRREAILTHKSQANLLL